MSKTRTRSGPESDHQPSGETSPRVRQGRGVGDAGHHAAKRFLEFFAATIRDKNTRTRLYDRTGDEITLDEVERIAI
jgi:hypothetical protein